MGACRDGWASGRTGWPHAPAFFWTLIWTTDGLTNSATPLKASDRARAGFWLSAVNCGAAGAVRSMPLELTRAAVDMTMAAQANALRFMRLNLLELN